jgi:hypothetical protein
MAKKRSAAIAKRRGRVLRAIAAPSVDPRAAGEATHERSEPRAYCCAGTMWCPGSNATAKRDGHQVAGGEDQLVPAATLLLRPTGRGEQPVGTTKSTGRDLLGGAG